LVGERPLVGGAQGFGGDAGDGGSRAGGEDAAAHRSEGGGEGHRHRAARHGRQVLFHFGGVPVQPAHVVGADRAHDLTAQQVGFEGAAGAAGAAGGDHDHVGLGQAGGEGGEQGECHGGRVTAGDGDPAGGAQDLTLPWQLRQTGRPGAGVRAAVEGLPGGGIGEPEVGAAVDHQGVVAEPLGDGGGRAVREGEEDDVVPGERLG